MPGPWANRRREVAVDVDDQMGRVGATTLMPRWLPAPPAGTTPHSHNGPGRIIQGRHQRLCGLRGHVDRTRADPWNHRHVERVACAEEGMLHALD